MIRFHLDKLILKKSLADGRRIEISEISDQTGIHRSTISRVLNQPGANLTADYMSRLCKFFDCTLAELAEYVEDDAAVLPGESRPAKSKARSARAPVRR